MKQRSARMALAAVASLAAVAGCGPSTPAASSTPASPGSSMQHSGSGGGTGSPSMSPTAGAGPPTSGGGGQSSGTSSAGKQSPVPVENNPPGDIPDNLAFVPYSSSVGHYRFTHPEGWAQRTQGATVNFTDKLNGVTVTTGPATRPPTPASLRATDVPNLRRTEAAFQLETVGPASTAAGQGVHIVYRRNSAIDPVTGRRYRDEVQRYELVKNGKEIILEMYGPVGADNVDAYNTMLTSLRVG